MLLLFFILCIFLFYWFYSRPQTKQSKSIWFCFSLILLFVLLMYHTWDISVMWICLLIGCIILGMYMYKKKSISLHHQHKHVYDRYHKNTDYISDTVRRTLNLGSVV
jgi:predicted membrane protein